MLFYLYVGQCTGMREDKFTPRGWVLKIFALFLDGQRLRNYYSRLFDMLMHKFLKVPKCEILTSSFLYFYILSGKAIQGLKKKMFILKIEADIFIFVFLAHAECTLKNLCAR